MVSADNNLDAFYIRRGDGLAVEMALLADVNLIANVLFCPLNKLCLLFSIIGKLHHAVMDFGVALGQHVDALSGRTEAFAKVST